MRGNNVVPRSQWLRLGRLICSVGLVLSLAPLASVVAAPEMQRAGADQESQTEQDAGSEDSALKARSRNIREILGFDSSDERLSELSRDPESSEAVKRYGYLFSRSELAEFELRMELQEGGRHQTQQYAESLEGYAGSYTADGGATYVIRLVDPSDSDRDELAARFPYPDRLRIEAANVTYRQLLSGHERVVDRHQDRLLSGQLAGIGIDPKSGRLLVRYTEEDSALFARIRQDADVEVVFEKSGDPQPDSCANSGNCNDPQRAGVRIDLAGGAAAPRD